MARDQVNSVLAKVAYRFYAQEAQELIWRVRRVQLQEQLGRPHELLLELVTKDTGRRFETMVGTGAEFRIERTPTARVVAGVITRLEYLGVVGGDTVLRVWVGSNLERLHFFVRSRIWQNETVASVLSELLDGLNLVSPLRYRFELDAHYEPHEYIVQYQESDFDFFHRLLENEGISYTLEADEDGAEKICLVDDNRHFLGIENEAGDGAIAVVSDGGRVSTAESISRFDWTVAMGFAGTTRREFDWRNPTVYLEHYEKVAWPSENQSAGLGEYYEFAPTLLSNARLEQGLKRDAHLQAQRMTLPLGQGTADSDAIGMQAGRVFELVGHGRADLCRRYLATKVKHIGLCPEEFLADSLEHEGVSEIRYQNHVECIDANTPFRPARATRNPRVYGPQTAIVVGASDRSQDDIHVDEFGRVRVLFHWDRDSRADERASCWVRVSQSVAGAGWGSVFTPRVGMEVVVEFLDGDPLRPLITGCVYNGKNQPPFSLPQDKTKSGLKTSSSPSQSGYNELSFEDSDGQEEIHLHAQRNMDKVVRNNDRTTVYGNQTKTIKGEQTISVSEQRSLLVEKNEHKKIIGQRALEVHAESYESYFAPLAQQIYGALDQTVLATNGPGQVTRTVEGGQSTKVANRYDIECGEFCLKQGPGLAQSDRVDVEFLASNQNASLACQGTLLLKNPGVSIQFGNDECMEMKVGKSLSFKVGEQADLVAGKAITVTSDESITLVCGKSSITLTPKGIEIKGPKIVSEADFENRIDGRPVKLNL